MKKILTLCFALILSSSLSFAQNFVGKWKLDDGSAIVEVYKAGDCYNGKTYYCSMKVKGDVLKVKGSLDKRGLLGRTMDWFRVK